MYLNCLVIFQKRYMLAAVTYIILFINQCVHLQASLYQMELDSRHLSTRVVHTRYGTLRGFISTLSNRQLQPVEVFLGVPYAGSPIGPLRFMPPVTSPHWKGIRVADSYGNVCPQKFPDIKNETKSLKRMPLGRLKFLRKMWTHLVNQSEDCLFLNIYAPAIVGMQPLKLPVMVFIHGESYEWNAGNPYDGRVLSSYGNVIVVTINYRLGVLGFLPSVDRSARGNYGLMDQVAALHWIQDNIIEFGGDPENVTVFGQGHGAACVNLLMLSPMAKGLFRRAIMQSGSALCPWAIAKDSVSYTHKLAEHLNCTSEDSMGLIECLRKLPLHEIMSVSIPVPDHLSAFGPTIDGIVIPKDPIYLMETKPDLFVRYDLLLGTTKVESYFGFSAMEEIMGIDTNRRDRILRTLVRNLYNHHLQQIFLTVVNEYMDWSIPVLHPTDIFAGTVEALTDVTVVSPLIRTSLLHSNPTFTPPHYKPVYFVQPKTYFYVFGHQTEDGEYSARLGCIRGEDLAYVFGAPLVMGLGHFDANFTSDEMALAEVVMTHWTSFAKYGDPNVGTQLGNLQMDIARGRYEHVVWPEFTAHHQKYLSISLRPKVHDHYKAHKLSYWLNLIPYLDISDNTTTSQHNMLDRHHDTSLYDGVVRESYKDVVQAGFDPYDKDGAGQNKTNGRALKGKNTTDIQVYGLDSRAHLSALGVTIAVGCSLLMLNVVVFAAIYYQKDKINMAKNVQKAMYQVEKGESEEDQSYKQPYLLKDAPSSLILHEFEPIQSFKEPQPVFDLVIESGDIKPHQASELQADIVPAKPHKVKTVTFCETQPLLIEPPEPFSPGSIKCHEQLAFSPLDPSETEADVNS